MIGKKDVMAVTGVVLVGFVIGQHARQSQEVAVHLVATRWTLAYPSLATSKGVGR
jgi:hypothetical protein